MDDDPFQLNIRPAGVLDLRDFQPLGVDLFVVWDAAEALASPDLETRIRGVSRLVEVDAVRQSSLIAYLFATRMTETDIQLRTRVVGAVAGVFNLDVHGFETRSEIRDSLMHFLSAMRTRQIFALLQVMAFDPSAEPAVATLLSYCSFAGEYLADIAGDRQAPLSIRKLAVYFTGQIGFLDAEPALARLGVRLGSRLNSRWSQPDENDEASLSPLIEQALKVLRAP